ncbi:MAG: hypothetical protein KDA96_11745 [Planctomycetaceae bacterium]|nr:hypothetical protein [Planctomycetaceae bacterium]
MLFADESNPPQAESDGSADAPAPGTTDRSFVPGVVRIVKTVRLPSITFCMAPHASTGKMFCGGSDFGVYAFDPAAEKPEAVRLSETGHESYVTGMICHEDIVVSGSYDGSLIWWNTADGSVIRRVANAHGRWIRRLALSPDGTRLASVADDMQTRIWNVASGECLLCLGDYDLETPNGYPSMLYAVTWSADGAWLATGDKTGRVLIRDSSDGRVIRTMETPVMYTWDPKARRHSIGGIRSLAFSPDGRMIAVGGMGQVGNIDHLGGASRIEVFRTDGGERVFEIEDQKYKGLVEGLRFSSDSQWLLAAGGDHGGFLSVYDMTGGNLLTQEKIPNHVHDLILRSDNSVVTVGHEQAAVVQLEEAAPSATG